MADSVEQSRDAVFNRVSEIEGRRAFREKDRWTGDLVDAFEAAVRAEVEERYQAEIRDVWDGYRVYVSAGMTHASFKRHLLEPIAALRALLPGEPEEGRDA